MTIPFLRLDYWKRRTLELLTVLSTSIFLAGLVIRFEIVGFVVGLGFLISVGFLILQLQGNLPYHRFLFLIPLLIISLPVQRIFLTRIPLILMAQFVVFPVILSYFVKFPAKMRSDYLHRIKPLVWPTVVFAVSFILAYAVSGNWTNADWGFLLSLLGSIGYAYLACIYCKDLRSFQRILWVLIGIGIFQLPVMYAMGRGWTNHLPGALSELSNKSWGGLALANGGAALRYPGLFGDYELLAEYLDITVLFCIGLILFASSKGERVLSILAAGLIMATGFYTGTRAFPIGLAVGLFVMVNLFIIKPYLWKKLKSILILSVVLITVFYFLSTQEIFSAYIDRLLKTDIRLGYYDSRTDVWKKSFSMMHTLPFTGYGTRMTKMFENIGYLSPHSLYFSMLLKAGYPGILAILIFICAPFLWMARILQDRTKTTYHIWTIIILSVWGFWTINEIKIEFIRYPFYMNIIFFLLGIFTSFYQLALNKAPTVLTPSV